MRIHFERIGYNGSTVLEEKTQKIISVKTTFIVISAEQAGYRTGRIQDRTDTGQDGYRTGLIQDRNAGQVLVKPCNENDTLFMLKTSNLKV